MNAWKLFAVVVVVALLPTGHVRAGQKLEVSGVFTSTREKTEVLEFGSGDEGHKLILYHEASTLIETDPTSPFHLSTGNCSGTMASGADGSWHAQGHCVRVDRDGDTYALRWELSSGMGQGKWELTGGSGKWHGATGGGTFVAQNLTAKPSIRGYVRYDGVLQMP